jgi:predicted ATP-dependent endonuclease of OLD family
MYLKQLKLQNYRLFKEIDISFQHGMNVLVGKNSTGKSTVLEAVAFLLSNNNANIPAEEIIPYVMRNQQKVQARITGFFELSNIEKESICSILEDSNERNLVKNTHVELIFIKTIIKSEKSVRIVPNIQSKGNGISNNPNLMAQIVNSMLPKLQMSNIIRIIDTENGDAGQQLLPLNQLMQMVPQQSSFLNQYVRNMLYDMKQGNSEDFNKIKNQIVKAYPDIGDMDVEFDPKRAQVQIYFRLEGSDIKIPLESEGWGIREFIYLLLTLYYFPDTIILKDEALTHMHKSLLSDFILAIDGLQYQLITTSHIKELIKTLDFGNIIICHKYNGSPVAKNIMREEEINKVLDELGYTIDTVSELDDILL